MAAEAQILALDGISSEGTDHDQVVRSSDPSVTDSVAIECEAGLDPLAAVAYGHISDVRALSPDTQAPSSVSKTSELKGTSMCLDTPKITSPGPVRGRLSDEARREKLDEVRKKKVVDQQKKGGERRASVQERKRKLEEEERNKKEALLKKLTETGVAVKSNPAVIRKKYASSTSNLIHTRKEAVEEPDVTVAASEKKSVKMVDGDKEVASDSSISSKLVQGRQRTASSTTKSAPATKAIALKIARENKRPISADPTKPREPLLAGAKTPIGNGSKPARPASVLDVRDKKMTISSGKFDAQALPGKSKCSPSSLKLNPNPVEEKETPNRSHIKSKENSEVEGPTKRTDFVSSSVGKSVPKSARKAAGVSSPKLPEVKAKPKTVKTLDASATKSPISNDTSAKECARKAGPARWCDRPGISKTVGSKKGDAKSGVDEAEKARKSAGASKKQLVEHGRKAKKEAGANAKAEEGLDEEELLRGEKEETHLVEEIYQEDLSPAILFHLLKPEEEQQRASPEKARNDRDEREILEKEQTPPEESKDKAKVELEIKSVERQMFEQEQDAELDAEPVESKKENVGQSTVVPRLQVDDGIYGSTEDVENLASSYIVKKIAGESLDIDVHQAWVIDPVTDFNLPHCEDVNNTFTDKVAPCDQEYQTGTIICLHIGTETRLSDSVGVVRPDVTVDEDELIAASSPRVEQGVVIENKLNNLDPSPIQVSVSSTDNASMTVCVADAGDAQCAVNSELEAEPLLLADETAYVFAEVEQCHRDILKEELGSADSSNDGEKEYAEIRYNVSSEEWRALELAMKVRAPLIEDDLRKSGIGTAEDSREGHLWQVMEGKVELSECF